MMLEIKCKIIQKVSILSVRDWEMEKLVCQLYGLSSEEVDIVDGKK